MPIFEGFGFGFGEFGLGKKILKKFGLEKKSLGFGKFGLRKKVSMNRNIDISRAMFTFPGLCLRIY